MLLCACCPPVPTCGTLHSVRAHALAGLPRPAPHLIPQPCSLSLMGGAAHVHQAVLEASKVAEGGLGSFWELEQ